MRGMTLLQAFVFTIGPVEPAWLESAAVCLLPLAWCARWQAKGFFVGAKPEYPFGRWMAETDAVAPYNSASTRRPVCMLTSAGRAP